MNICLLISFVGNLLNNFLMIYWERENFLLKLITSKYQVHVVALTYIRLMILNESRLEWFQAHHFKIRMKNQGWPKSTLSGSSNFFSWKLVSEELWLPCMPLICKRDLIWISRSCTWIERHHIYLLDDCTIKIHALWNTFVSYMEK